MKVSLIFAQNEQGEIGFKGPKPLPWHHAEDLKRFKRITFSKPMVMGRDTFNSLPGLLSGRDHYVLTSRKDLHQLGAMPQVHFVESLAEIRNILDEKQTEEFCVIGGGGVIDAALMYADTVYRTVILDAPLEGDVVKVKQPGAYPFWGQYELVYRTVSELNPNVVFEEYLRLPGAGVGQ